MNKKNMFIVIKRENAIKYLTEVEIQSLEQILSRIERGRADDNKKSFNTYYVCNTDEPYAEAVHNVIIGGEVIKDKNKDYCSDACGCSI